MGGIKRLLPWIACILFDLLVVIGVWLWGYHRGKAQAEKTIVTRTDTVTVKEPVPAKESRIGVVTVPVRVVPLGKRGEIPSEFPSEFPSGGITVGVADSALLALHDSVGDTLRAAVPITQKEYRDSDYAAWVSGFMPRLDSIRIYRKTVARTQDVTKRHGFSIGLTGGYGYGLASRRIEPFVGVGVTWNVFR